MAQILAIDTSSAWCSVALSINGQSPKLRHQAVTAGASQILLPWVREMLAEAAITLDQLDAIAVGIGPGAFTGVRLGIAAVQGLAATHDIPVIPIASLDALAMQVSKSPRLIELAPRFFAIAVDARMDEVYWAKYENLPNSVPVRVNDIQLSKPENVDLSGIQYLAGSAINEYKGRLGLSSGVEVASIVLDESISISALGILDCALLMQQESRAINVRNLEPLYVRDKVALTTAERMGSFKNA